MAKKKTESVDVKKWAIEALLAKKGNDVVSLDLTKIKDTVSEHLIIAHGDSSTHVRSLCDTVEDEVAKQGVRPYRIEGAKNGEWIIIDYVDVTVHVFYRDKRDFYALEELWSDAVITKHSDAPPVAPKVSKAATVAKASKVAKAPKVTKSPKVAKHAKVTKVPQVAKANKVATTTKKTKKIQ